MGRGLSRGLYTRAATPPIARIIKTASATTQRRRDDRVRDSLDGTKTDEAGAGAAGAGAAGARAVGVARLAARGSASFGESDDAGRR